ncbi:MAG: hypothetical protein ABL866_17450 [Devosia sp.]
MLTFGHIYNIGRTLLSKLGLDPTYRKIFAIGFNKTATKSIDAVFAQAGLVSIHRTLWRSSNHPLIHWPYQAFSDGRPDDFARLDRRFPKALFILNTRDLGDWLDSRLEHYRHQRSKGTRPDYHAHRPTIEAVSSWIVERNHHHAAVLRYFAETTERLLVINYIREPDAARQIAAFVGGRPPAERPHIRSLATGRKDGILVNRELIEATFAALGVPPEEWNNDLLCPSLGDVDGLPADTRELSIA